MNWHPWEICQTQSPQDWLNLLLLGSGKSQGELQGFKEEREGGYDTHNTSTKGEIESQEEAKGI